MSGAHRNKTLSEVLIEGGLCSAEQIQEARRREGVDLITALVADGVLVEDRAIRTLSGMLGLEVVGLDGLDVHERVLRLIPAELAQRHLALPIAMKRSGDTDFLYLSVCDPLDQAARAELQKAAGCQLVVVLAAPSQLRAAVERLYGGRPKRAKGSTRIPASLPSESPPPLPRREAHGPSELRTEPPPPARPVPRNTSSPGAAAAHLRAGQQWELRAEAPKQIHLYDHRTGDILDSEGRPESSRPGGGLSAPESVPPNPGAALNLDPRDELRDAILRSGEHPQVLAAPALVAPTPERSSAPVSKSGLAAPKLPAFRLDNLPSVPGQADLASRFSPVSAMTEPTTRLSVPDLPHPMPTVKDGDFAATILDMPLAQAFSLPEAHESDIDIEETTADEQDPLAPDPVLRALELPVRISDAPSPFDDLRDVRHRPGLEKTGVIPLAEILRDEFNPKQLDAAPADSMLGSGDIPVSPDEARARAVPLVSVLPPEPAAAAPKPSAAPPKPSATPVESRGTENEPTRRVPKPDRRPEPARADSQPVFQSLLETEAESTDKKAAPRLAPQAPSPEPRPTPAKAAAVSAGDGSNYEEAMVQRLLAGDSLTSADRARLVLALGRLLLERGVLSKEELVAILRDAR